MNGFRSTIGRSPKSRSAGRIVTRMSQGFWACLRPSVTGSVLISPQPFLRIFRPDKVRCIQELGSYIL